MQNQKTPRRPSKNPKYNLTKLARINERNPQIASSKEKDRERVKNPSDQSKLKKKQNKNHLSLVWRE